MLAVYFGYYGDFEIPHGYRLIWPLVTMVHVLGTMVTWILLALKVLVLWLLYGSSSLGGTLIQLLL